MKEKIILVSHEHELSAAIAEGLTLIEFWAPWCQPCRLQQKILKKVVADIGGRCRIYKVDVDENPRLKQLYQVKGIPTLLLFNDGVPIRRLVGVQTADVLLEALESINAKKN